MGFWSLVSKNLPFPNQMSRLSFYGTEVWDFGVWFLFPIACAALAATSFGQCYFGTEVWDFGVWLLFLWQYYFGTEVWESGVCFYTI